MGMNPGPGYVVGNNLRVNGSLENSPCVLQLMAQLRRIDQVAVVGQPQDSFYIIKHQRLCIFPCAAAGRGIPHMAYADIAP